MSKEHPKYLVVRDYKDRGYYIYIVGNLILERYENDEPVLSYELHRIYDNVYHDGIIKKGTDPICLCPSNKINEIGTFPYYTREEMLQDFIWMIL